MTSASPHGVIDLPAYDLAAAVLDSWDAFIALVDQVDLSADTRLRGWSVREIALHVGTWDGRSALSEVLVTLGSTAADEPLDTDAFNAELVDAHPDATAADIRAALVGSRDAAAELLTSNIARDRGTELVASVTGPMPLLTVVHAQCFELALHALDVVEATGATCDPVLLRNGVAALADSTGCLAARAGADATIGIIADEAPWTFTSRPDGSWTTAPVEGDPHGPRISGRARDLLEAAAGRAEPVRLLATRRLRVSHPAGLTALTPILDQVPGLPGGKGLALAAKSLGGIGSLFRKR
ncbi:maleylpyruvate isomerase N-terminal domain-containing protein [Aeromicrobium sp. NPDC092404]|uniref:maleylpyruvate isomerase N-terminal domain-containing protein n=1 Tax=Aeromicrobium sp. NPDC092404 TaxID=3154976 RepID=UPI003441926F